MELRGVDSENLNIRVAEQHPLGAGYEVVETSADTDNEVAVLAQCVRRQAAGYADAANRQFKRIRQAGVAGLCLRNRNVERLAEVHCGLTGLGVTNAAACNEHRLLGSLDHLNCLLDIVVIRYAACNVMYALLEEVIREVEALTLYILRKRDNSGAAVCGIGQDTHCVDHRAHQLLRTRNAVPVLGNRLEAVRSGHGQVVRNLELLENRIRLTGCKVIGREQQQRDVIDGSGQCCGYHVCCANADGRGARDDLAAVVLLCVADGGVCHALLVAALINSQVARILLQCLTETDYHTVTEDREHAVYEGFLFAVHLDVLLIQELYDCLTDCHSGFAHCVFLLKCFTLFPCRGSFFSLPAVFSFDDLSLAFERLLFF